MKLLPMSAVDALTLLSLCASAAAVQWHANYWAVLPLIIGVQIITALLHRQASRQAFTIHRLAHFADTAATENLALKGRRPGGDDDSQSFAE